MGRVLIEINYVVTTTNDDFITKYTIHPVVRNIFQTGQLNRALEVQKNNSLESNAKIYHI